MLDRQNVCTQQLTHKFKDKWYGPFKVIKKVGTAAYHLTLPP